jgi:hypothetical protein
MHAVFFSSLLSSIGLRKRRLGRLEELQLQQCFMTTDMAQPLVTGLVLTQCFGLLSEDVYQYAMPSSSTLDAAAERAQSLVDMRSMPNKLTEDEVKEEFSLEAYAKALLKANPGMHYDFKTHENGTLKHLIIVVSGVAHIFQNSQQIIY